MSDWHGTGSNVKVLTWEFERNHPFEEIYPPRITDAAGRDALQNMLELAAARYDEHIATYLHHIRDLRELRTPRSTGGAGYKRAEVAGVAEARTVTPPPTVDLKGAA